MTRARLLLVALCVGLLAGCLERAPGPEAIVAPKTAATVQELYPIGVKVAMAQDPHAIFDQAEAFWNETTRAIPLGRFSEAGNGEAPFWDFEFAQVRDHQITGFIHVLVAANGTPAWPEYAAADAPGHLNTTWPFVDSNLALANALSSPGFLAVENGSNATVRMQLYFPSGGCSGRPPTWSISTASGGRADDAEWMDPEHASVDVDATNGHVLYSPEMGYGVHC